MCNRYLPPQARNVEREWHIRAPNKPRRWVRCIGIRTMGPLIARAQCGFFLDQRESVVTLGGLIPGIAKSPNVSLTANNARPEQLECTPSFRDAWVNAQRCVISAVLCGEPDWKSGQGVLCYPIAQSVAARCAIAAERQVQERAYHQEMWSQLLTFLGKNPRIKAKELAAHLGKDRTEVNQVLYEHSDKFFRDDDFKWSVRAPEELRIEFRGDYWLTSSDFEDVLSRHCTPWHEDCESVVFAFKKDCRMLLATLARLLALCNQLKAAGKKVSLDFAECADTLSYLDRMDFFEVLASDIAVLPRRPRVRRAVLFKGKNDGVVELRVIDPASPDNEIPRLLERSFVRCVDESYSTLALTVIGEPFKNVLDHSRSNLAGFAGLQAYKNRTRIQVVISDNGLGIVGTLKPVLDSRYPEIASRIGKSQGHPGVALLKEVFATGQLSRSEEDDRGTGLKSSGDQARKYSARISVRQEDFELRIDHRPEGTRYTPYTNLVRIDGTHISFDFKLDGTTIGR